MDERRFGRKDFGSSSEAGGSRLKQDIKSEEARAYLKEFEEFEFGYSHKSPIYISRQWYEMLKDELPPGRYIVMEDK